MTLVSSAKYLEVFIHDKLLFKEQIKVLEVEVARSVGILCKLKHVLSRKTLLQLCHALIHPLLTYGIIIWWVIFSSFLTKLKTLQNKALRAFSELITVITLCHFTKNLKSCNWTICVHTKLPNLFTAVSKKKYLPHS